MGQKALGQPAVNHPNHGGVIQSWDEMEAIWEYCFTDCLHINTNTSKVFLTETHYPTNLTRETMIEIMFELFEVNATYLHIQAVLALFAAGLTTGCVIDSGEYSTTVYPVAEGFHLVNASKKLSFGGLHINQLLEKLICKTYKSSPHITQLIKNQKNQVVRNIKENYCYIQTSNIKHSSNIQQQQQNVLINSPTSNNNNSATATNVYTLPDGTCLQLQNELYECTESFFDPLQSINIDLDHTNISAINTNEISLPKAVLNSIMDTSVDLRRSLLSSIVLTGGNTNFQGFQNRLTSELKAILPGTMSKSLNIIDPINKKNAIWNGGSILTSLSTFNDQWITEDDYYEYGSNIIHKKCCVYI